MSMVVSMILGVLTQSFQGDLMQAALETLRSEAASQAGGDSVHGVWQKWMDEWMSVPFWETWTSQSLASHHHVQKIRAGGNLLAWDFGKSYHQNWPETLRAFSNQKHHDCCMILALFSHFIPLCVPSGGLPGRRWKGLVRTEQLHCSAAPWLDYRKANRSTTLQWMNRREVLPFCLPAKWCEPW